MNKKLAEALDYCHRAGVESAVFGIPFTLSLADALALKENSACNGMVLYQPAPELTAHSTGHWLGCFTSDGNWQLPGATGTLIFLGSHLMLTQQMALRALWTGRTTIICHIDGRFQPLRIYRFLLWSLGERLYRRVTQLPHDSFLRKTLFGLAMRPTVQALWRRVFKREGVSIHAMVGQSGLAGEALYTELCRRALEQPQTDKISAVPRRVLLVNAGLAAGGAERQIVNTLIGLKNSNQCESVALLAEYIDHAPHLDFFLHEVERQGIEVAQMQQTVTLAYDGLASLSPPIAELAADLPPSILEEILNLVEEFRARRPHVVHAWQDASSIKAGLAAVIAGVPRIILASRNVIPTHFTYYQEFMHPAYRALATLDCVSFLNNSEAGAVEYTQWLGMPRERFTVVRNGVDLSELKRIDGTAALEYRRTLGIPAEARVVGSVFRFWAEKRPMLWLEAAALLAQDCPDVHFLIVGEGPMRSEMEVFIKNSILRGRVHLPGARPEVATPLSAMDLFLLTSEFEGTPNVVLEAQWLGLPIVATEAGGTREAFEHGASGLLAATPTSKALVSLILAFFSDAKKMELATQCGPQFVTRVFGAPRMIEETLSLYRLKAT